MIATLVAFMPGWRVLVLQCTFALLVIGANVTYAVVAVCVVPGWGREDRHPWERW